MGRVYPEDKSPPAKRQKLDFSKTTTVLVGRKEQPFLVYDSMLNTAGEFFATACKDIWQNDDKTVRLPEADVKTFSTLLQWVLTGQIIIGEEESPKLGSSEDDHQQYQEALVELYCLAHYVGNVQLCNATVDEFIAYERDTNRAIGYKYIVRTMEVVPANSGLVKLMVRQRIASECGHLEARINQLPAEFVSLLALECHKQLWETSGWKCKRSYEGKWSVFHDKKGEGLK